jgi:hypothetical protein
LLVMMEPSVLTAYDAAYKAVRRQMAGCALPILRYALQFQTPIARTEIDWGVVDALTDLVREATGVDRLFLQG